jgi:hypothetical protein
MVVILSREHNTKINLVRKSWAEKKGKCKYINSPSLRRIGEMEVKFPGFLNSAPYGSKLSVSSSTPCLNISNFESPLYAFFIYSILHCGFITGHSAGCNRTPDASSNSKREHAEHKSRWHETTGVWHEIKNSSPSEIPAVLLRIRIFCEVTELGVFETPGTTASYP